MALSQVVKVVRCVKCPQHFTSGEALLAHVKAEHPEYLVSIVTDAPQAS